MSTVPFSVSSSGYLKYRIYDSTDSYDEGSNLFLEYRSILQEAINKWDSIVSPNTTYFNTSPYYYTHDIEIDVVVKDFAMDHDTQMDIYLTKYVYFGFPASYGKTFPTAGKFEIDIDFLADVKSNTITDGKSSLFYLFLHAIGHILGIGTLWGVNLANDPLSIVEEDDGVDGYYYKKSSYAYNQYLLYFPIEGGGDYVGIPLEDNGGDGTVNHHFEIGVSNNSFVSTDDRYVGGVLHKGISATEVMSVWTKEVTYPQFISGITAGVLQDIGYEVDYSMTDSEYNTDGPPLEWLNIDYSNYPSIEQDVETTKSLLMSIISSTNRSLVGNTYVTYDVTIYGVSFTGSDSNVLGQASWSTGEIWLNNQNSGYFGLNGVDVSQNVAVMFHEILHVLGCVGVGERGSMNINDSSTLPYNTYKGPRGVATFRDLLSLNGKDVSQYVENIFPLEDDYGYGTETYHFEEDTHRDRWINGIYYHTIKNEIMTGIMNGENFITRMTLGVLEDLGFSVNYNSADVVDVHSDLIISEKPDVTYLSQKEGNTVYAETSFRINDEVSEETTNLVGLNIGKYYLTLSGQHSFWKFMGFHFPTSSSYSNKQEFFINNSYPNTTIRGTSSIGSLTYTFYSGEIEITVTGDFGNITMQDEYGTLRRFVFDRMAPRHESVPLSQGITIFGILDMKEDLTMEESAGISWMYKASGTSTYTAVEPTNYKFDNTERSSVYWVYSTTSFTMDFLVDYTLNNDITYQDGTEVSIILEAGINHFGTLVKRFRLLDDNDPTLVDKTSLMKYSNSLQGFVPTDYSSVLDNLTGYTIYAYSPGIMKAILS